MARPGDEEGGPRQAQYRRQGREQSASDPTDYPQLHVMVSTNQTRVSISS